MHTVSYLTIQLRSYIRFDVDIVFIFRCCRSNIVLRNSD